MRLTPEGVALLKQMAREGILLVPDAARERPQAEALEEEGLVRSAGQAPVGGRRYVLSGRGVQAAREVANLPPFLPID